MGLLASGSLEECPCWYLFAIGSPALRKVPRALILFLLRCWCVFVFFTLTDRALTVFSNIRDCQSGTVLYCSVRGLLERRISEEHLQSSNESIKKLKHG